MARFTIYSKDGQIKRYEGEPQYSGSYMGVDFVEFRTISSPTPIDWQIGDYVDYYRTGKRYKLYSLPMPKKVARKGEYGASFEYSNVQLYGATKELEIAPFRDLVTKDNKIHFSTRPDISTYEDVYGVARRIQECMDDLYPNKWRIEVYDTDDTDLLALLGETKEYSVRGGSCLDALSQIYDTWKNVGWIHTYDSANGVDVITIGRANVRDAENTSDAFAYGIGRGLTSIKKASANKDEFATRLYVYGSERNIQTRYYNGLDILNKDSVDIRNLMLPVGMWGKTNGLPDASKAYLQADDSIIEKYGLIPRTVYFDGSENEEIYPSIKGLTMAKVRQAMIDAGEGNSEYLPSNTSARIDQVKSGSTTDAGDKESVESDRSFVITLNQVGFNIAEQGKLTSEGHATISMKSGMCAGRDFKVLRCENVAAEGALRLTLERVWDESVGLGYPNTSYEILAGDELVLLDIPMPDYYITLAANELLEAGEKMLADYTRVSAFYEPSVDAIKIKAGGKLLQAGMFMQMYDEDIIDTADNKDYVLIDTLTIDEKSDLPIYKVTLRDQKRSARTYSALEDMIEDAKESNRQEINRVRQYTDRRFRSAQETLEMLESAFSNFSDGISPATIRTMAMLVGDEGLQFKFTAASNSLTDIACPFSYDETTKQMKSMVSYLKHMTLGIKTITTGAMSASSYKTWYIPAWAGAVLDDGAKSYYVYVKASKTNSTSECLLSETPIGMEDVSGYYHFLVGILNSEYDGKRDFITLYGFTEVLPGQITTDVLRSANSNLIIDLLNAKISAKNGAIIEGKVTFTSGSSGLENLSEWSGKQDQIDSAITQSREAKASAALASTSVENLDAKIEGVEENIREINQKLDGVVESYFEPYTPTRNNLPASQWIEDGTEEEHIGDTFTNTSLEGDDAGKSWRWLKQTDGSYDWQQIADSDAAKALALAGQAQAAADGKNTTFLVKPNRAYKAGDLWIVGADYTPTGYSQGDLLTANQGSSSYVEAHWSKFVRYTDDTAANQAKQDASDAKTSANEAKGIASAAKEFTDLLNTDTILTEVEKRDLRRLISEITECQDTLKVYSAVVTRSAVSGNPWYLVGDKSYAEWTDGTTEYKVSQKDWAGFYSSNMHTHSGNSVTKVSLKVEHPFNLKLQFGSDAEGAYDFLVVGALNKTVDTSSTVNNLNDNTKQACSYNKQGKSNLQTKTFAFDGGTTDNFIQIAYKKDTSRNSGTDSGYYRILNNGWTEGNSEYIMDLKGSFHRYYLTLMQNGLYNEAEVLTGYLEPLIDYLAQYDLWEEGNTEIPENYRNTVNSYLVDYYTYTAEVGFDIAMDRINDAEYLTSAMKNGRTIVDGGLVMSSMVAVADTESATDADVEAFLNGSDFAKDATYGKLILAGGIPESTESGSTDLVERAKEARTKIYESGRIETDDIHATGGTFENVTVSGIFKNPYNPDGTFVSNSDNYVNLSSSSITAITLPTDIEQSGRKVTFVGYFIITCGTVINVDGVTTDILEISNEILELTAVRISSTAVQWHMLRRMPYGVTSETTVKHHGMFAGLRPKVRILTSSDSLSEFDHTIVVKNSATITLTLPTSPQEGQTYRLLHTTANNVTLNWNGKSAINVATGSTPNATFSARRSVVLTYSGGIWYVEYINLAN